MIAHADLRVDAECREDVNSTAALTCKLLQQLHLYSCWFDQAIFHKPLRGSSWPTCLWQIILRGSQDWHAEDSVVVIEAALRMELEAPPKGSVALIWAAEDDSAQPGVDQSHGTHCTWLVHHIAVEARAKILPARPEPALAAALPVHAIKEPRRPKPCETN